MRAVILCGGSGSRLWPLSRESLPKQFIKIFDGKSLLDLTIERLLNLDLKSRPIIFCNKKHGFLVKDTLKKYNLIADIFFEPEGKSTCAAIYLAAKHCYKNENLVIMPSDHLIPKTKDLKKILNNIEKNLVSNQWITLGIKPTKPSDSYGYIKIDKRKRNGFFKVLQFIEKPNTEIAKKLFNKDNYFWNSGVFIANSRFILDSIYTHASSIALSCDRVFEHIVIHENKNEFNFNSSLFSKIPSKSIDYAVMEYDKNIYVCPFESVWSDVGSWDSVSEIVDKKKRDKNVIEINSKDNFIKSENRVIATIGIEDLIIVDSKNATLITKKNHSEKVRSLVDKLNHNNLTEGKEHSFEYRPWGFFENIYEDKNCKVKKLQIDPQKRLSLQYHNFRSEHWLVVKGTANIHIDGKNLILKPGQSIDVPQKSRHYIENKTKNNLIIIETQLGSYFGEDDIIRIDDPYFR